MRLFTTFFFSTAACGWESPDTTGLDPVFHITFHYDYYY